MLLQVESIRGLARKAADGVGEERQCGGWTRAAAGSGRAECYHRERGVAREGGSGSDEPVRVSAMFMYVQTAADFAPRRDFPHINEDPVSREWNELMATLQQRAPEADPDEWWAPMELVFDTSWPQYAPGGHAARRAAADPPR